MNYVTTPNFVKIGPNAAEISRFFDFSRWRRLDFKNVIFLTVVTVK